MQQKYRAKLEDGNNIGFYVNDLRGYYYGEVWILNPEIIDNIDFKLANTYEFQDETLDGFMIKVTDFIKEVTKKGFVIEED